MIREFEPIEHEFYTEKYLYYTEDDASGIVSVIDDTDEYLGGHGAENIRLLFKAVLCSAASENTFDITVPEEKDGITISRVEICTQMWDRRGADIKAAELPTLKHLYIPSGVSSIFVETELNPITEYANPLNFCKAEISLDNPYLCVYENGIYSKDMTQLFYLFSPQENNDGCFELPSRVKRIKPLACYALKGLRRVMINGVNEIEFGAFVSCPDLEYASVRAKRIGNLAFEGCESLKAVELLKVIDIGHRAFCFCLSLREIRLPASLRSIGDLAFFITGIGKLTIPYGVKNLGETVCSKDTILEIYAKKNGELPFEYKDKFAVIGTVISVRLFEKGEKEKTLFEFAALDEIDSIFQKDGFYFSEYDKKLKHVILDDDETEFFRYDEIPLISDPYDTHTKMLAAWTRCHYPYKLYEEAREIYKDFVAETGKIHLTEMIYDGVSAVEIAKFKYLDMIGDDALSKLIDLSAQECRTEITAVLMQKLHERRKNP